MMRRMQSRSWACALLILVTGCAGTAPREGAPATSQPAPTSRPAAVTEFQGEYRFLSNFWPAQVVFERVTYPTSEHAYQAAKTLDPLERTKIAALPSPAEAKRAGRALERRDDWEQVKFDVMERCVRDKFTRNADLREKLLATGD